MNPRIITSLAGLVVGLALLLPLTHRLPAPPGPTLREEIAATRAEVARFRVQLRRQQADLDALSQVLLPLPSQQKWP